MEKRKVCNCRPLFCLIPSWTLAKPPCGVSGPLQFQVVAFFFTSQFCQCRNTLVFQLSQPPPLLCARISQSDWLARYSKAQSGYDGESRIESNQKRASMTAQNCWPLITTAAPKTVLPLV